MNDKIGKKQLYFWFVFSRIQERRKLSCTHSYVLSIHLEENIVELGWIHAHGFTIIIYQLLGFFIDDLFDDYFCDVCEDIFIVLIPWGFTGTWFSGFWGSWALLWLWSVSRCHFFVMIVANIFYSLIIFLIWLKNNRIFVLVRGWNM
jgi:hypothetical protein